MLKTERPHSKAARTSAAPYGAPAKLKKETNLSSDGHVSVREDNEKSSQYRRTLQEGTANAKGIMSKYDENGDLLIEYDHQRQFVKKAAGNAREFMLLAHDAGLGKTATWYQLFAFLEILKVKKDGARGGARAIVVAPPSCLTQWEDTANVWLNLPNKKISIIQATRGRMIDADMLRRVRVLIISRHMLAQLYTECWEYKSKYEQNERGSWVGKWVRKEGVPLHPFWREKWDLLGIDEAHFMRNPTTAWCQSHYQLSVGFTCNGEQIGGCAKRIAITATPVFNGVMDIVGVCKCMGASPEFMDKRIWSLDKQCKTINPSTSKAFQKHTDRVKDDILNLPEIHQETVSFSPEFAPEDAASYNNTLHAARKLKLAFEKGKAQTNDLKKLMGYLSKMQQMLVSPRLAEMGAEHFKKHQEEIMAAATEDTGSLKTLHAEIKRFQREGHAKVMVSACHVTIMHIAALYMANKGEQNEEDYVGEIYTYDGELSQPQRTQERNAFMRCEKGVLFLSIGAGGAGVHMVPSNPTKRKKEEFCRAMLFWGSRPFSPMQVWQTLKRIHRIGQAHECFIRHLIARGSVDDAIQKIHEDKSGLANAIVDNDWSNCDETAGEWRSKGRIVDMCCPVENDGAFAPEPGAPPRAPARAPSPSLAPPRTVPVESKFFNQAAAAAAAEAPREAPQERKLIVKLKLPPKRPPESATKRVPNKERKVTFGPATLNVSAGAAAAASAMDTSS